MEISGLIKNSFVDYPKNIACVVFTAGCNMNCWYCHNHDLISETKGEIDEEYVFSLLEERKKFLDGVVITGGEPTLQPDLTEFIKKIKSIGLKVKLDTNGTNLSVVKNLVNAGLLDYIAMDVKAPLSKYSVITSVPNIQEIKDSIEYIKNCGVDYEFRTTFAPNLTSDDIKQLVKDIGFVKNYALQQYRKPEHIVKEILKPHLPSELNALKEELGGLVNNFIIRNI
ncbi:MAG: anaerobic ribonucleoside-triphosphate reductase activating protein [Clostridia bacterium]|nr:anaerobic ribonucleoside-triphosphate reductase activating protein [Clostridia bacterium]